MRDRRYKQDAIEEDLNEVGEVKRPVIQFISVPSEEWADQWNSDTQKGTKPSSVSDSSANSWEKLTPRENEEQALRNIDSLSFSSD